MTEQGGRLASLSNGDIESLNWHYIVELKPGAFTDGRIRRTSSMTRDVVRQIPLKGLRCLDIGAQECLLAAMMVRQGAEHMAAYDRLDLTDRIELLKEAYHVDFDYYHSLQLNELPERLKSEGVKPFDVVVFAGVLYHMIDPLAGLATSRSFVREGGLMVVETSVIARGDHTAEFNAKGRYYPGSNYFQISLGTLDYFIRMLRLRPLDLLCTKPRHDGVCRVTIVARAVDSVVATEDDKWMRKNFVSKDMEAAHLHYDQLATEAEQVPYQTINKNLTPYESTKIVDVWATYEASAPHPVNHDDGRLRLEDQS